MPLPWTGSVRTKFLASVRVSQVLILPLARPRTQLSPRYNSVKATHLEGLKVQAFELQMSDSSGVLEARERLKFNCVIQGLTGGKCNGIVDSVRIYRCSREDGRLTSLTSFPYV